GGISPFFLGARPRFPPAPRAKPQRPRNRCPADAVAAMDAARRLASGEKAIDRGFPIDVDFESAEPRMASRRHLKRPLGYVDVPVKAGLVHVRDLLLDDIHWNLGRIHENSTGQPGAPRVDFLGHSEDDFRAGGMFCRVRKIALEKFVALPVSENCAGIDEASRMRGKAEKFLWRAAHRLEVDHLDADQWHPCAKTERVAVTRNLRRIVVDVKQPTATTGAQDDLPRLIDDERAVLVIDAPRADYAAIPFDKIDDRRYRGLFNACF